MSNNNAILGLVAQTSLHAGTGSNVDVIDLPIQREAHTGHPCIFGSATKGALRTLAEQNALKTLVQIFGPNTNNASEHAGALIVHDAKIVLMPIRSMSSAFCWICCPSIIKRLGRDFQLLGIDPGFDSQAVPIPKSDQDAIRHGETQESEQLYLEEYLFSVHRHNLSSLIRGLSGLFKRDGATEELESQLVLVSDNTFTYLTQHATQVNARIAIDFETKIVKQGALWYEESLPPETVLYVGLSASASRNTKSGERLESSQVLLEALGLFSERPWLQVGGNETVGMGWCHVQTVTTSALA